MNKLANLINLFVQSGTKEVYTYISIIQRSLMRATHDDHTRLQHAVGTPRERENYIRGHKFATIPLHNDR